MYPTEIFVSQIYLFYLTIVPCIFSYLAYFHALHIFIPYISSCLSYFHTLHISIPRILLPNSQVHPFYNLIPTLSHSNLVLHLKTLSQQYLSYLTCGSLCIGSLIRAVIRNLRPSTICASIAGFPFNFIRYRCGPSMRADYPLRILL